MGLDIRIPIGLMFAIVGALLTAASFFLNSEIYRRSLGINVNLWWGLVMLAFGLTMIFFGRRGGSNAQPPAESPDSIETEKHRSGEDVNAKHDANQSQNG